MESLNFIFPRSIFDSCSYFQAETVPSKSITSFLFDFNFFVGFQLYCHTPMFLASAGGFHHPIYFSLTNSYASMSVRLPKTFLISRLSSITAYWQLNTDVCRNQLWISIVVNKMSITSVDKNIECMLTSFSRDCLCTWRKHMPVHVDGSAIFGVNTLKEALSGLKSHRNEAPNFLDRFASAFQLVD